MSVKIDDKIGLDNINTKKTLICNYHKALVDPTSTENDINNAKGSIISFKNKLLKSIGNNKSVIKELSDITSIQGKTL